MEIQTHRERAKGNCQEGKCLRRGELTEAQPAPLHAGGPPAPGKASAPPALASHPAWLRSADPRGPSMAEPRPVWAAGEALSQAFGGLLATSRWPPQCDGHYTDKSMDGQVWISSQRLPAGVTPREPEKGVGIRQVERCRGCEARGPRGQRHGGLRVQGELGH